MQCAEQRFAEIIFPTPRRDPHIAERKFGHERMVRLILSATLEIVAKLFNDFRAECELLRLWKVFSQARIVRNRLRRDCLNKRHEFAA